MTDRDLLVRRDPSDDDGVILTTADLDALRAELSMARETLVQTKNKVLALDRKVKAAEFLFRRMRSDQMAAESAGRAPAREGTPDEH